jgi:glycosyltransferase involved in cell wall biosynthesis
LAPFWSSQAWENLYLKRRYLAKTAGLLGGIVWRIIVLTRIPKFDFVFVHREAMPLGPPVLEWFIARIFRKKIIFDFDDAIWIPNTSAQNSLAAWLKWPSKFNAICRWSYRLSCGNTWLAQYARTYNPATIVNPTTIDTEALHNPRKFDVAKKPGTITIGWTGTHSTLSYLAQIVPVMRQLESRYANLRFVVIANTPPGFKLRSLEFIPWSIATEIGDLLQFDIGIMPLTDDPWSKGKCGFKALQYMALEIPVVASRIGVNSEIIDPGVNGFLCDAPEDWEKYLTKLIEDAGLRRKMGVQGREKVIRCYSVSSNTSNFLSLFR